MLGDTWNCGHTWKLKSSSKTLSREFRNREERMWSSQYHDEMLSFLVPIIFSIFQHLHPLHWLVHSMTIVLCCCHSAKLLLSVHQPVLHPQIQNQLMERVGVVAAQSLNSFEQQGLFPARQQANTSDKCMNVHCLPWVWPCREYQPTSVWEPCCKTKDKFKLHERLLTGSWAFKQ